MPKWNWWLSQIFGFSKYHNNHNWWKQCIWSAKVATHRFAVNNFSVHILHVLTYLNFRHNISESDYLKGYSLRTPEVSDKPKLAYGGDLSDRPKRGVVHLYNMISCVAGCDPLMYKGYGCYCGFLGSGQVVDGIDRWVLR